MSEAKAPIAVALDAPDLTTACEWARATAPAVSTLKVGLQAYLRDGAQGVAKIREAAPGTQLFLDLKLHDIPNTVAGAVASVRSLAPQLLTVHALGGPDMVAAAAEAAGDTVIAAVTILTSMDAGALDAVGITGPPEAAVLRLAAMAVAAGAGALVCSPHEVAAVRAVVGPRVRLVTPGVRPAGSDQADQRRVATPAQALADGADLLVIGRPITAATDPGAAAGAIGADLAPAVRG